MEKLLQSGKFCAALVLIAGLATLVSTWGVMEAGRRAVARAEQACQPEALQGIHLEMARTPEDALEIFGGGGKTVDRRKEACIRSGLADQVRADYLLIPAYSGLSLALFLFVRSLWIWRSHRRKFLLRGLLPFGLLFTLAMLAGDLAENRLLTEMIERGGHAEPSLFTNLRYAASLKWGALALSALVLAASWTAKTSHRLVWVQRLSGLATAILFFTGLVRTDSQTQILNAGMVALSVFWLAALVHAVAVAIEPEPVHLPLPSPDSARQP